MFEPMYPIATTSDGVKHLFIDVKLSDYFELMIPTITENGHRDYHYDGSRTYSLNDDGRFCVLINKRTGYTGGWINYTGWYDESYFMSVALKNSIRPLFKDEYEFMAFASFLEPSVRLAFKENEFNENTDDEAIFNTVVIRNLPVRITSVEPLAYELSAFYVSSETRAGEKTYDWNDEFDRIPITVHDFVNEHAK